MVAPPTPSSEVHENIPANKFAIAIVFETGTEERYMNNEYALFQVTRLPITLKMEGMERTSVPLLPVTTHMYAPLCVVFTELRTNVSVMS